MEMTEALWALVGAMVGGIAVRQWTARSNRQTQEAAARDLESERKAHSETRESLAHESATRAAMEAARLDDEARRNELEKTFRALASDALNSSSEQFLKLAKARFSKTETQHSQELAKRQQAIEHLVKPLGEGLEKLGKFTNEIEQKRQEAYGELRLRLEQLATTTLDLGRHSNALATALRGSSQARGRWGELALRNIVEFAGMTEHCDFTEQPTDRAGNRPDLVVKLPGGGLIPVDAKVPFVDYESACREEDPERRQSSLSAHAIAVRNKVLELAKKDYASQLDGEVDFTVMFVPAEPILSAALEHTPDLYSEALRKKVLPVTPVTLIALLRTVGVYWQQERMAKNAEKVWDEANELQRRLITFADHLGRIRKGLHQALDGYNDAVGSYQTRILPQGRKVEELGGTAEGHKRLGDLGEIDRALREAPSSGASAGGGGIPDSNSAEAEEQSRQNRNGGSNALAIEDSQAVADDRSVLHQRELPATENEELESR